MRVIFLTIFATVAWLLWFHEANQLLGPVADLIMDSLP